MKPVPAVVAVGSNVGDRARWIRLGLERLAGRPGTRVTAVSTWIETEPAGGPPQGAYLNGAVKLSTELSARALLEALLEIETELGRVRLEKNGPRILDLDLIFYGDCILDEPGLKVPHPRAHKRDFVLRPIAEIAPDWMHPVLNRSVRELLRDRA